MTADCPRRRLLARQQRPTPAERARSLACVSSATLCAAGVGDTPVLAHATTADGEVLLVVPGRGDLVTALSPSATGDLPAVLTLTDRAPVPLREPVRAELWMSGWVTPVRPAQQRAALLAFAEVAPAEVLLDVVRTAALVRFDLADLVLSDSGPSVELTPEQYAAATPDPLVAVEAEALRHLDEAHPEALALLRWQLTARDAGPDDTVRPLGLDRWGFRLRIERSRGCFDVRIPFARPVTCAAELRTAMRQLLARASIAG
jgi:hypothetical protein